MFSGTCIRWSSDKICRYIKYIGAYGMCIFFVIWKHKKNENCLQFYILTVYNEWTFSHFFSLIVVLCIVAVIIVIKWILKTYSLPLSKHYIPLYVMFFFLHSFFFFCKRSLENHWQITLYSNDKNKTMESKSYRCI